MEGSSISPLSSSLLCQEDQSCLNFQMGTQFCSNLIVNEQDDEDYIKFLLRRERESNFGSNSKTPIWLIHARLDSINSLLNTQTLLGICNQTAYLSLSYFDRFLFLHPIQEDKSWVIKVLSIACLSLAVKMVESKSFALSLFSTTKGYDGFSPQVIQRMEIVVLGILEWNMRMITPFPYLHYFSIKFGVQETKLDHVISRAMALLMAIIKEIRLIDYRPSTIAAGAVLAAIDLQLAKEALKSKVSTISILEWQTSENQEQLFGCYKLMQRLSEKGNVKTPISREIDQTLSDTNTTTNVGTKRRLTFREEEDSSVEEREREKIQKR